MSLKDLVGDTLKKQQGEVSTDEVKAKYVGLYFSAHWCPPCRRFTPELAKFYQKYQSKMDGVLEIIFVSSDRDEAGFNEYYKDMPWLALPFANRAEKEKLSTKYDVRGIPKFVILTREGLEVYSAEGRQIVMDNTGEDKFPLL